jgi:hypothetical protein
MCSWPLRLPVVMLGVVLFAGCTSTSAGSPRPVSTGDVTVDSTGPTSPSSGTEPGVELPYAGAPAVENPLDTTRFQQDPCQSLTAAQAKELNVNWPGEPREAALGNACEFRGRSDRRALVEVAFLDKNPRGLSAVYKANEDGKWAFFEELGLIEGHPAAAYGRLDQRDTGGCAVDVGASDEIAFEISMQLSTANVGKKDPCETAAMVVGMVVATMKAGQ